MNLFSLIGIELAKIRRSGITAILILPVIILWIPSILNAEINFDTRGIAITPEHNFFIQGFMGMAWFMLPASLIICTVLLSQTERGNHAILKMLSLPVNTGLLCLAKFIVMLVLSGVQILLTVGVYYISAAAASRTQDYAFMLDPGYVCRIAGYFYLAAIPMAALFWMITTLITTPIFSMGIGLASIVPSVLMINTKYWFAYPMCYPFYVLVTEYNNVIIDTPPAEIDPVPWIPLAVTVTILALVISCSRFGYAERR